MWPFTSQHNWRLRPLPRPGIGLWLYCRLPTWSWRNCANDQHSLLHSFRFHANNPWWLFMDTLPWKGCFCLAENIFTSAKTSLYPTWRKFTAQSTAYLGESFCPWSSSWIYVVFRLLSELLSLHLHQEYQWTLVLGTEVTPLPLLLLSVLLT